MSQAAQRGEYPPDWAEIAQRVKDDAGWWSSRPEATPALAGMMHEYTTYWDPGNL